MSDFENILKAARRKRAPDKSEPNAETSTMPLDDIRDRASADTRPLNQQHVEAIAESIALLGLIEPLVVDSQGRLLAGGHRRAALHLLRATDLETFEKWFADGVPVHRLGLDSELQPDLALEIEVSENEKREPYSRKEVQQLADRLREAGYADTPGRPKKGEKRLRPALEVIVGKSLTTLRRYLNEEKTQPSGRVSDLDKSLKQTQRSLTRLIKTLGDSPADQALAEAAATLLEMIERMID